MTEEREGEREREREREREERERDEREETDGVHYTQKVGASRGWRSYAKYARKRKTWNYTHTVKEG